MSSTLLPSCQPVRTTNPGARELFNPFNPLCLCWKLLHLTDGNLRVPPWGTKAPWNPVAGGTLWVGTLVFVCTWKQNHPRLLWSPNISKYDIAWQRRPVGLPVSKLELDCSYIFKQSVGSAQSESDLSSLHSPKKQTQLWELWDWNGLNIAESMTKAHQFKNWLVDKTSLGWLADPAWLHAVSSASRARASLGGAACNRFHAKRIGFSGLQFDGSHLRLSPFIRFYIIYYII
jgi:hypothetical protein